jgi:uncharacterized SAM-binding protein YcdF (DUF218 family)
MIFLKFLFRLLTLLLAAACIVAILQFGTFVYFEKKHINLEKSDLILVFPGDKDRTVAAYTLAEKGHGSNVSIISKNSEQLKKIAVKYHLPPDVRMIAVGESRSTFEDAYRAREVIGRNNYTSVILVTSSYHMPRALFLLKTHLLSSGLKVDIQYYPVGIQGNTSLPEQLRLNYNEFVKIWGSTIEMVGNLLTGSLLYDYSRFKKVSDFIHKYLIF